MANPSKPLLAGLVLAGAALALVLLLLSSSEDPTGTSGPDEQLARVTPSGPELNAPSPLRSGPLADTEVVPDPVRAPRDEQGADTPPGEAPPTAMTRCGENCPPDR